MTLRRPSFLVWSEDMEEVFELEATGDIVSSFHLQQTPSASAVASTGPSFTVRSSHFSNSEDQVMNRGKTDSRRAHTLELSLGDDQMYLLWRSRKEVLHGRWTNFDGPYLEHLRREAIPAALGVWAPDFERNTTYL